MEFLNDYILLDSPLAKELYDNYARDLPVIDYHCHINPELILQDKRFENLTQIWLTGDHYKWRLMRNCGVDERFITGNAEEREKFRAFAGCLPLCIGNPIYIWCHMELKKYFGYSGEINKNTADYIYDMAADKLKTFGFSVREIIRRSNVEAICTTDDPTDNLIAHKTLAAEKGLSVKILPSFRPDKAICIEKADFAVYIKKLGEKCKKEIQDVDSLKNALSQRLTYFVSAGCKVSDHALDNYIFENCDDKEADLIFNKAFKGNHITALEAEKFQTYIMLFLAEKYYEYGIAMQLHFCCLRNNNMAMFTKLGPDTGFDSINSSANPYKLVRFLNALTEKNCLPKTIIYSLDPSDDKLINSIINCFQEKGIRGKIQHGSAWWFNDTENGMKEHLKTLAEYSVLGNFIGMLTDSRSFTSYVRHDYFRRILCNFLAEQVNNGKYPYNKESLKTIVENVCYYNVKKYMGI